MPDDLFINTIKGTYVAKPTGRKMLIFGKNGSIGERLKNRLEEDGHDVAIISSPTLATITPELFSGIEVIFLLAYDLEPVDVPIGDTEFLHALREHALSARVERVVFLRTLSELQAVQPIDMDVLTRAEIKISDSALPTTIVRSSILLDLDMLLVRALNKYASIGKFPNLPNDLTLHECRPILLSEAVDFLARTPEHEYARTYHFDLGGDLTISYKDFLDLFIDKERVKDSALGVPRSKSPGWTVQLLDDEKLAWKVFLEKTHINLVPESEHIKELFKKTKITPLPDAIKLV
jgi:nucleoside-diphosphate-sugar epimerase